MFIKIALVFLISFSSYALEIYSYKDQKSITLDQFLSEIDSEANFILGEYHYTPVIQKGHAEIIKSIVTKHKLQNQFSVGWEFLLHQDQAQIDSSFSDYKNDLLNGTKLIEDLMGTGNLAKNLNYLPIFETTKALNGEFLGLNAPRTLKRVITSKGLNNLDATHIPPNMELGNANYLERFKAAMGGHVNNAVLMKYYEAQCYTDSVMAYTLESNSSTKTRFLVVGAFHSDYLDGVVSQMKRYSALPTYGIKIIESTSVNAVELAVLKKTMPVYGNLADYLFVY